MASSIGLERDIGDDRQRPAMLLRVPWRCSNRCGAWATRPRRRSRRHRRQQHLGRRERGPNRFHLGWGDKDSRVIRSWTTAAGMERPGARRGACGSATRTPWKPSVTRATWGASAWGSKTASFSQCRTAHGGDSVKDGVHSPAFDGISAALAANPESDWLLFEGPSAEGSRAASSRSLDGRKAGTLVLLGDFSTASSPSRLHGRHDFNDLIDNGWSRTWLWSSIACCRVRARGSCC
jgi:hypothetical protein